jgi:hypothetical protein
MAVVAACGPSDGAAPSASASANGPTPTPSVATPASAEIEDELSTRPVELLKLKVASGVKNKEPDGVLESAKPGQRVYVHLTLRNRSKRERKVEVVFKVDGKAEPPIELTVGDSWSWRTWAYKTLSAKDTKGKLSVEVTDDAGNPVADAEIPILAK